MRYSCGVGVLSALLLLLLLLLVMFLQGQSLEVMVHSYPHKLGHHLC
jgi:hypothetical protein